jgi:hypothetical protein
MRNNIKRPNVIRMDSNRNDIGSRNYLVNLSGFSFLSFCQMGISRFLISETQKQLWLLVLLPFVDPSQLGVAPVGREILWREVDFQ